MGTLPNLRLCSGVEPSCLQLIAYLAQDPPKRVRLGHEGGFGGLLRRQEEGSHPPSSLPPLGRDCVRTNFSQKKAEMRKGESLLITAWHLDPVGPEGGPA